MVDFLDNTGTDKNNRNSGNRVLLVLVCFLLLLSGLLLWQSIAAKTDLDKKTTEIDNRIDNLEGAEPEKPTDIASALEGTTLDSLKVKNLEVLVSSLLPEDEDAGTEDGASTQGERGPAGATGSQGSNGSNGSDGSDGSTGATGAQGPAGSATCPNGDCLSLQASSPGTQETGNLNVSGTAIANAFSGGGSGLTTLNASNVSSGSLADARLSSNVVLLDRNSQTFTGNSQIFQNTSDSSTAFQVRDSSSGEVITIDTTNKRVYIGDTTADSTGSLLIMDIKNTAGDPTGVEGGTYFNSVLGKFRCFEGGVWLNCTASAESNFKRISIKDEFISPASLETGEIGELGWQVVLTGTPTIVGSTVSSNTNHVGLATCTTSATNPSGCLLHLGPAHSRIFGGESIGAVVRTPSDLTATNIYVGLGDATNGTSDSTDAVHLRKIAGTANWEGEVINNGSPTSCDTGVVAVAGNYVQVRIEVNSAANSTSFYVNGATTASCTISGGLPTGSGRELGPLWQFRNADVTSGKTAEVDLFWFEKYLSGNRWD